MDWPKRSLRSRIRWSRPRWRCWRAERRISAEPAAFGCDLDAGGGGLEAEAEAQDTDDMLDALVAYRRAHGRRDIGDELAQGLLRYARGE